MKRILALLLTVALLLPMAGAPAATADREIEGGTVALKVSKDAGESIHLSWKYSYWLDSYRIYRKAPGETEFTAIAEMPAGFSGKTEYDDLAATGPGEYAYVLTGLDEENGETVESGYTETAVIRVPDSVQSLQKTMKGSNIKLTWKKVPGAARYCVLRSVDGGAFKEVYSTTSTSYVAKRGTYNYDTVDYSAGFEYAFYVAAVWEGTGADSYAYSDPGNTVFGVVLSKRNIEVIKNPRKGTVALMWNQYPACTGYEVYYAAKKKAPKEATKAKLKIRRTQARVDGLKKGKTYYFWIRPVQKLSDGTTQKGAWSKAAKIKIKK